MAKNESIHKQGYFEIAEIKKIAKANFSIKTNKHDANITRRLQRYMKDNNVPRSKFFNAGNTYYYAENDVEAMLESEDIRKYFAKLNGKKSGDYRTNKSYYREGKARHDGIKQAFLNEWESAGLTPEEGNLLEFDRWQQEPKYLQVGELKFLGRKGLVLRAALSDDEKEELKLYERHLLQEEADDRKIEEMFAQKKMEIMITALFREKFTLNEELLYDDVSNYVRGGERSTIFLEDGGIPTGDGRFDFDINHIPHGMFEISRSYNRLNSGKGYVRKKKSNS